MAKTRARRSRKCKAKLKPSMKKTSKAKKSNGGGKAAIKAKNGAKNAR